MQRLEYLTNLDETLANDSRLQRCIDISQNAMCTKKNYVPACDKEMDDGRERSCYTMLGNSITEPWSIVDISGKKKDFKEQKQNTEDSISETVRSHESPTTPTAENGTVSSKLRS